MTPAERVAALEAAAREAVSHPDLQDPAERLDWLAAQVHVILPGDDPMINRFFSGGGWAESLRWIGRSGQGVELSYGAPYGQRSFIIIRVAGLPGREFQLETEALDRTLQAMIVLET